MLGHEDGPGECGSHGDFLPVVLDDDGPSWEPFEAADEVPFDDAQPYKLSLPFAGWDLNDPDRDSFLCRIEREYFLVFQVVDVRFLQECGVALPYIRLI